LSSARSRPTPERAPAARNVATAAASSRAILDAGLRLALERGDDFTTQDIVKEAGVALKTLYRHYPNKDRLLVAVIAELIAGFCERLSEQGAGIANPVDRLRHYILNTAGGDVPVGGAGARMITAQHWRLQQDYPAEVAAAIQPFADLLEAALVDAQAAGLLAPRDPARDAWLMSHTVMSAYHHYAFAPDDPSLATVAEDVWQYCLAAVNPD
jgi:AcrR family transcriptional regulator